AKGFLHVSLGNDPSSPFGREQGLALVRQASTELRRNLDARLEDPAGRMSMEERRHADAFREKVRAFDVELEQWSRSGRRDPRTETGLRDTSHALETAASEMDAESGHRLHQLSEDYDTEFTRLIAVTAFLFAGCCAGVLFAGRSRDKSVAALRESE